MEVALNTVAEMSGVGAKIYCILQHGVTVTVVQYSLDVCKYSCIYACVQVSSCTCESIYPLISFSFTCIYNLNVLVNKELVGDKHFFTPLSLCEVVTQSVLAAGVLQSNAVQFSNQTVIQPFRVLLMVS